MKDIFDECTIGNLKLKSRVIRTGTWESQREEGGFLSEEIYQRYENIAKSGVGAIISEMFALDPRDRFAEFSTDLNYPRFIKDYKQITEITHSHNVPILGQLAFFYYNDGINQKVEANDITKEGIRHLQADVIMAAKKFAFANFDGIQINMGNNFYLARFTNPYFNQREDEYGGNTLNRMRIILEIIKVIKNNFDLHINCKINPTDLRKGGITEKESIEMCKLLDKYGADSIQITSRTISNVYEHGDKHPFLKYTDKLQNEINTPVILGGTLRDMKTMNEILNNSKIELFSMSKPFVAQPNFLEEWKKNGEGVSRCRDCKNCYSKKTSKCFQYE